jgi:hypothetical protein
MLLKRVSKKFLLLLFFFTSCYCLSRRVLVSRLTKLATTRMSRVDTCPTFQSQLEGVKHVRCLRVAIGSCRESSGTRARVITTLRARDVGKVSSAFESIGLRTSTTPSSRKGDAEWLRVGVDVVVERDREVGCHVGSRLQQRCAQS